MSQTRKHELWQLKSMQAADLNTKILLSATRIREWIKVYGEDGVYISFSGGKDSTVLLHLVRVICGFDKVPAVFVDTGLEYPEIRMFVKSFDNVVWLKPEMNFKQVIEKYGYPFFSKETSEVVYNAKIYLRKLAESKIIAERTNEQTCRINTHTTDYEVKGNTVNFTQPPISSQKQTKKPCLSLVGGGRCKI